MEINFKSSHADEEEAEIYAKGTVLAERKLRALKKYFVRNNTVTYVYVEFGKETEAHHSGAIWKVQINLDSLGKRYHSKAVADRIETAVEMAVSQLETEARTAKSKSKEILRSGGRVVKGLLKGLGA
jgi:ribosome-associated translation inhibitor RaiA